MGVKLRIQFSGNVIPIKCENEACSFKLLTIFASARYGNMLFKEGKSVLNCVIVGLLDNCAFLFRELRPENACGLWRAKCQIQCSGAIVIPGVLNEMLPAVW